MFFKQFTDIFHFLGFEMSKYVFLEKSNLFLPIFTSSENNCNFPVHLSTAVSIFAQYTRYLLLFMRSNVQLPCSQIPVLFYEEFIIG